MLFKMTTAVFSLTLLALVAHVDQTAGIQVACDKPDCSDELHDDGPILPMADPISTPAAPGIQVACNTPDCEDELHDRIILVAGR